MATCKPWQPTAGVATCQPHVLPPVSPPVTNLHPVPVLAANSAGLGLWCGALSLVPQGWYPLREVLLGIPRDQRVL